MSYLRIYLSNVRDVEGWNAITGLGFKARFSMQAGRLIGFALSRHLLSCLFFMARNENLEP